MSGSSHQCTGEILLPNWSCGKRQAIDVVLISTLKESIISACTQKTTAEKRAEALETAAYKNFRERSPISGNENGDN